MPKRNGKRVCSKKYQERYALIPDHIKIIVEAIKQEDLEDIRKILRFDEDFNECFIDGSPPIIHAVESRNIEIIKAFLEVKGIDLNKPDVYKSTAINIAVMKNELEIAKLLFQHGADINTLDVFKRSPLDDIARYGDLDTFEFLLKNQADPYLFTITDQDVIDIKMIELIEHYKKRELSRRAISACSVLYTAFSPKNQDSKSTLKKLPFEINSKIAGFLIGNMAQSLLVSAKEVTGIENKSCKYINEHKNYSDLSDTDNYHMMFQYSADKKYFDLRHMPFFSFMMHEKINIIDIRFAKLNLRLAWKLLAGINNVVSKDNDDVDLEYCKNPWDLMKKHAMLTAS